MLVCRHLGHPWLLIVYFGLITRQTQADHILAIFSYAFSSPYLVVRPLIKELVERGHEVTVISGTKHFPTIDGAHHIRVLRMDNLLHDLIDFGNGFDMTPSKWRKATWISEFYYYSSQYILADRGVQDLINNSSAQFDLIIMNTPISDAFCGFAQHFKAPRIGISAYGSAWIIDYLAGNSAPSVYEPMSPLECTTTRSSSILDKWDSWVYKTEEWLLERLVYLPPQIKLYRQYFNDTYSNFDEIRRNFSLILVNQHFSLGRVKSNVPNLIEIAGMHMCFQKDCKLDPMPDDLQQFMDGAEHGVIYFSLGVEIYMKWLPDKMKLTFLEVFSNLKQRVLWKYDGLNSLKDKSDNIFFRSYLPQKQILNHPKTKLFITHGGLLSIIETAYYGVPVLSLPLYYDQFANAQRMDLAGVGQTLKLNSISIETLNESIYEILHNSSYANNIKRMSSRFRDQPMSPLKTAVWWTEYILRHNGAPHMRLLEHEMSFMQYYNFDILPILFGRIGLTAIVVILLAYKLINWLISNYYIRLDIL
ncbi:UDP-glycosyltransferase UGT4-like [Drosophila tropicalis]|uniref:UDP-glycosyltransferase UGT4-like n=1 Tax=Drosophila tropicalis TaxID=46794 RepID=UPI0035AB7D4E